jgi:Na+/H+ antiporter NhaD/arsenite permease-like protein
MGFIESFVAWMVIILFIALIVMGIMTFILNWFVPQKQEETDENGQALSAEEIDRRDKEARLKRNMFLVIVAILGVLAVTGGINGLINVH